MDISGQIQKNQFLLVSAKQCLGQLIEDLNQAYISPDLFQLDSYHNSDDAQMRYFTHCINALIESLHHDPSDIETQIKLLNGLDLNPEYVEHLQAICASFSSNQSDDRIIELLVELVRFRFPSLDDRIRFLSSSLHLCAHEPTDTTRFAKVIVDALFKFNSNELSSLWTKSAQWFIPILIKFKRYGAVGHFCRLGPNTNQLISQAVKRFTSDGVFASCRFLFGLFHGLRQDHISNEVFNIIQNVLSLNNLRLIIEPQPSSSSSSSSSWAIYSVFGDSHSVSISSGIEPSIDVDSFFVALCVGFARDSFDQVLEVFQKYSALLSDQDLRQIWMRFSTPETFLQIDREAIIFQILQVPSSLYNDFFLRMSRWTDFRPYGSNPDLFHCVLTNISLSDQIVRAAFFRIASRPGAYGLISAYKQLQQLRLPDPFFTDLMIIEGDHGGNSLIDAFAEESEWTPTSSGFLLQHQIRRYEASRVRMKVPDPKFPHIRALSCIDFVLFQT